MPQLVAVHRVTEVVGSPQGEGEIGQIAITYSTPDVPPRTVFVDKEKDTPQERQRVIKEDLEAARAARPTPFELP